MVNKQLETSYLNNLRISMKVKKTNLNHTTTEATLQFSHPENLEEWPGGPASKNSSFQYRLRRLDNQHFAMHFFPQVSFFSIVSLIIYSLNQKGGLDIYEMGSN